MKRYPIVDDYTSPETSSLHLKIDLWKRRFLWETTIYRGYGYESFRECIMNHSQGSLLVIKWMTQDCSHHLDD